MAEIGFTLTVLILSQTLSGCGQGGRVGEAPQEPAAAPSALPSAIASTGASAGVNASVATPPAASAPAQASDSAPVPVAAPATASDSAPTPVLEVHTSALHKKLSVSASGKITVKRTFGTRPDEIGFGQVPSDRVEELHHVLRAAGFCALAPKQRESSPGYIIIEARFADVACTVELPDKRWDKDPKAKKVIEAVRKLESEGCPKGCKP